MSSRAAIVLGIVAVVGVGMTWNAAQRGSDSLHNDRGPTAHQREATSITGRVINDAGQPIAGAEVRFATQSDFALTGAQGRFQLVVAGRRITATAPGYFIGGQALDAEPVEIVLRPVPACDNPDYDWIDPAADPGGEHNCANCHSSIYDQWQAGGHARALQNRRFLGIQSGTNWHGEPAGWSLADDYPSGAGVCAACHAPTVPASDPAQYDLRQASGVAARGVHCDYCHKVAEIAPGTVGLAHGRLAVNLLRPHTGQIFFGPLPDVDRDEDIYSPLLSRSRFCATCHEGVVFGVPVYTTYSEWLASPARRRGQQCQACHMRPNGRMTNVAPGAGGHQRDPQTLASHTLLPGGRAAMLRGCVDLSASVKRAPSGVEVRVVLRAHDVGHRVPTGFIDRHLLVCVEAETATGQAAAQLAGPRLQQAGDAALNGTAGYLYGRLLTDADGAGPIPFWRAHGELIDTRLVPERPHRTTYRFHPATAQVQVTVRYRRFWRDVAREKDWPDDEIVVHQRQLVVPNGP